VDLEERMAICENESKELAESMARCEKLVEQMCEEQKEYAKKYIGFLDMLIEEKMESKRLRDRALDAATSTLVGSSIMFLGLASWYFIKEQIKK